MTPFRVIFLLACVLILGGSTYLSYYGIWRESGDLNTSVRAGSGGGYYSNTRVK